ncbi:MAG: hypothetical protein AB1757_01975 [Acidobacteriota bacterium]
MTIHLNRKFILISGIVLLFIAAVALYQINTPTTNAQSGGCEYIFDVRPDAATLSALPATGTTFYLQGKVYPFRTINQATCEFAKAEPVEVGTWRAWGEVADDGRLVMKHSFLLRCGTVELQGVTGVLSATGGAGPAIVGTQGPPFTGPTEILAVVGGIGVYRGINGEAEIRPYCSDPTQIFRYDRPFCLQIQEVNCCKKR